jgi:spermidine/putrescine transport system permease protein
VSSFAPVKLGLSVAAWLTYVFLYVPVLTMVTLAFNDSVSIGLPWAGFTTKWFQASLRNTLAIDSFSNSVQLALAVGALSSLIGLSTAVACRRAFAGRKVVLASLLLPLLMPGIVLAIGQAVLFNILGIVPNLWTSVLLGHLVYTIPFAFLAIFPRLHNFDRNIEAAAMDLGADRWTTFRTIVLPQILPGVIASFLFCFTLSYDEFIRTLFLIGTQNTLPMYFWSIMLTNASPETSALATLSVLFSLAVVATAGLTLRWRPRMWRIRP